MALSPVVMFAFNRDEHTERTLAALRANELAKETDLIIFCDGPRNDRDLPSLQKTREIIFRTDGFRSVRIVEGDVNRGLADSVVSGVSQVLQAAESVIVLEDDIETSPFFLRYMNEALVRYCDEERVVSISGYKYPGWPTEPSTYFVRATQSWGWGTWRKEWSRYESDGSLLYRSLKRHRMLWEMDFRSAPFYSMILRDQIAGRNSSWAIRWYALSVLNRQLTLYPCSSLCRNLGFDESGTHGPTSSIFDVDLATAPVSVADTPVEEYIPAVRAMRRFLFRLVVLGALRRGRECLLRLLVCCGWPTKSDSKKG